MIIESSVAMDKKELVNKVNEQLKPLDLPAFRKKVTTSGRNVHWLLRNISIRNEVNKDLINMLKAIISSK